MKRRTFLASLSVALFLVLPLPAQDGAGQIRVACIGDSITFGAGIRDRARNSYPAVLGRLLGPKYDVRNFGVNGATLLKKGDKPYWTQRAFADATDFAPNIVIIKLGTNDSKPQNWRHKDEFDDDLRAMVDHFAAGAGRPKIWLCKPVPVARDRWGISEKVVAGEVIPLVVQVAKEKDLPVIDLYKALSGKPGRFVDGVHPDAQGAEIMAQTVRAAVADKAGRLKKAG